MSQLNNYLYISTFMSTLEIHVKIKMLLGAILLQLSIRGPLIKKIYWPEIEKCRSIWVVYQQILKVQKFISSTLATF